MIIIDNLFTSKKYIPIDEQVWLFVVSWVFVCKGNSLPFTKPRFGFPFKVAMNLSERIGKVPTTALAVSAVAVAGGLIGGLIMKKVTAAANSVDKLPEKWGKVGKIKDLLIYPVKGMPGISVNEAVLGRLGLKGLKIEINK